MNKNVVILLGGLAVVIIGLMLTTRKSSAPTTQMLETPAPEAQKTNSQSVVITSDLLEQNGSGEYGTASLRQEDGKVKVTLDITGAPEGVTQPAHIHMGSCPEVGAVKYPLTFPVNGKSETTLDTTLDELKAQLPLAINVHKSAQEPKVYVACGDLAL